MTVAERPEVLRQTTMARVGPAIRRSATGLPSVPLALWVILFVCVPAGFVLTYSFQTYTWYDVELPWTLENYIDLFSAGAYVKLFIKTIIIALIITVASLILASPMAYYISRVASRRVGLVFLTVIVLPLWMNLIIRNYAWISLTSTNGVLDKFLQWFGLPSLQLIYTRELVLIVGVSLFIPIALLILYATMANISHEVEEASLDLGSSRFRTFRKVIFPLSGSAYQMATLLIFMPTLAFYVSPMMLGGQEGSMLATALLPIVKTVLDYAQGSAFMVPIIILLIAVTYFFRRGINVDNLYRSGVGSQVARRNPRNSPWLLAYTALIVGVSYVPLVIMVFFSFDKNPLAILPLMGPTTQWYYDLFQNASMKLSLRYSLTVALESAAIVLLLSAPAAYAVVRFRFPGRSLLVFLSLLPMLIPEFITGMAILIFLTTFNTPFSLHTIAIGHVTLAVPFVFLTILAQQYGFDRAIEEASSDLGASPLRSFLKISLPLMIPALVAGGFLAITISFNDYVVAFLLTGGETTLPIYIFGLLKSATSPSANAVGTLLIAFVVLIILIACFRPWNMVRRGLSRARLPA